MPVNGWESSTGESTSPSHTFSFSPTSGNLLVAIYHGRGNPSNISPVDTDWFEEGHANGNASDMYVFWKESDGTETSFDLTSDDSHKWIVFVAEFTARTDMVTPIATMGTDTNNNGTSVTPTTDANASGGEGFGAGAVGTTDGTFSFDSGWTVEGETSVGSGGGPSGGTTMAVGSKDTAFGTGTTESVTASYSGSSGRASGVIVELEPAASTGTTYDETNRDFSVSSTLSATDALKLVEAVSLSVASALSATDALTAVESGTFSITSTISGSDAVQGGTETFDETGLEVTVSGTFDATDNHLHVEVTDLAVTSSVDLTDTQDMVEATDITASSSLFVSDALTLGELVEVVVSSVISGSEVHLHSEPVDLSIAATIDESDIQDMIEDTSFDIVSFVSGFDDVPQPQVLTPSDFILRGAWERVMLSEDDDSSPNREERARIRST